MTTYPNMGLSLPTRGAPGSGVWGDTDDANWAKVDAHDHTTGKGLPITTAAISINADLPFSALWAPTQLHRVQFSNIAGGALAAGQRKSLFVSDGTSGLVANELYWLNSSGNKVQLTTGNTLNFAAFVGGIGGDYTSVGAQLNFADSQKAYEFKEGTADINGWARLRSGDLRLFPFNTTAISAYVGQAAPVGIVSPYTVTWPLALPGAGTLLQIDNTGQISATSPSAFDVTLAANKNFTVSGTGLYKHGTKTVAVAINAPRTGAAPGFATGDSITLTGASPQAAVFQIENIPVGARITAIRARIKDSATGPTKIQMTWFASTDGTYGAAISSSAVSAGSGAAQTLPMTGLTTVVAALTTYTIQAITTTGAANTLVYAIDVDYDQP